MTEWTFTHEPAEDDSTDPQWVLDQHRRWTIQDARAYGGGLVVVEHSPEDEPGFWVRHHGTHHGAGCLGRAMAECARRADHAALAAAYVAKIGYDPFEDDPAIDPEIVRQTLAEYDRVATST